MKTNKHNPGWIFHVNISTKPYRLHMFCFSAYASEGFKKYNLNLRWPYNKYGNALFGEKGSENL